MKRPIFDDAVEECLEQDQRFNSEAYYFIRDALDHAQKSQIKRRPRGELAHLTAAQLCEALRGYAVDQFGPMARLVLSNWSVHSTGDIGEIVYLLIGAGAFARSDGDARSDFDDLFDFADAFDAPFLPPSKIEIAARGMREHQGIATV